MPFAILVLITSLHVSWYILTLLTHWVRNKMTAIIVFWFKLHCSLFPMVQLTIRQHWFWKWFEADEARSNYFLYLQNDIFQLPATNTPFEMEVLLYLGRFTVGFARQHKIKMRPRTVWFQISREIGRHACAPNLEMIEMHRIHHTAVTFRISRNGPW